MEPAAQIREIYLKPGDFCFGEGNLRLTTVLGSCVSIILWHPQLAVGGMCHYVLPSREQPHSVPDGRYGDEAMELFMIQLDKRHTPPRRYQARIYGGGNMFGASEAGSINIGSSNIEKAYRMLRDRGFIIAADHVGGLGRRRVAFDIWSGEVRTIHIGHEKAKNPAA